MSWPRWLKIFSRIVVLLTCDHAEFQANRTNGSKVMGQTMFLRAKTQNKCITKFDIAALARSNATKICIHVDKCHTDWLAQFQTDPLSGSRVMSD